MAGVLYECKHTVEPEDGCTMHWFSDRYFDLDVWVDAAGQVDRFLLSYNKPRDEHALSWSRSSGYLHFRVDAGEGRPGRTKGSPLLIADGMFDARSVASGFAEASQEMDRPLAAFVHERILQCPAGRKRTGIQWLD